MSDSTALTEPNVLHFPAFAYGEGATCRRRMKAEAKKWAKRYQERGDFPEPKCIPVSPGSIIFCDRSSAQMITDGFSVTNDAASRELTRSVIKDRKAPQWFFYVVIDIETEIAVHMSKIVDNEPYQARRDRLQAAHESFVCRYSWGALATTIHRRAFNNTIEMVSRRLEGMLTFWEKLDMLRYVDLYLKPVTLSQLLVRHCFGYIGMWVDTPTGDMRQDLRTALEHMSRASADEIHARLLRELHKVVDTEPGVKHREWLNSPGIIEAELERCIATKQRDYDDLTAGHHNALFAFLHDLVYRVHGL